MKRPALIALAYLAFGVAWIFFSDRLVIQLWGENLEMINKAQAWKGYVFVAISALFILLLIKATYNRVILRLDQVNALFSGSDISILQVDSQGVITDSGSHVAGITGHTPNQLRGKELTRIIPTEEHKLVQQYLHNLTTNTQEKAIKTLHLIHANGHTVPVRLAGAVRRRERQGDTFVIAVQDISYQMQAEQDKLRSEELFERIFEELPVMVTIYDPEVKRIRINKEFESITGWKKEKVNEIDLLKACYPDEEARAAAREWMKRDRAGWKELELTTRQGNKRIQEWCNIHLSDDTIIGIGMDVTELKEKERQVEKSRNLFESIFNTAEVGLCLTDRDGYFRMVNEAYCEIYGYSREELIGDRITKILPEQAHEEALKVSREFVDGEILSLPRTWQVINKGGKQVDVRVSGSLIDTGNEKLQITSVMDITEIKSVQRQLQQSKEQLETAQDIADLGYWELNLKTNELLWGEGVYKIWEVTPQDFIPTFDTFYETIHPVDRAAFDTVQQAVIDNRQQLDYEHRIVLHNGKIKWVLEKGWLIYGANGNPEKLVGAVQDITKRKQDEEKITFQAEMLEAVGQAVIVTDTEGKIIYWNRAAENMYGWKAEEVMGKPVTTITPMNQTRAEAFQILRRLLNGESWAGEFEVKDKAGRRFPVYVTDSPILDDQDNLRAIIGVSTDITERKEAEQQLAESERKYRLIFENTSIPIWIFERESLRFLEVNHAAINKYGFSKEEFLNMTLLDIRDKEQQVLMENSKSQLESGSMQEVITIHRTKSGKRLYVNIYSSIIDYYGTEAELVTALDITNQVDTEREITNAIMRSTEEERGHLAREIHDGLTQTLSIVSLNMKNLVHDLEQLKNEARFNKALKYLSEAIEQSRTIAHRLMPKTISDFGLVPAISELVQALSASKNVDIQFEHDFEQRLDPDVELNLFRITQEALSNVLSHSGADTAQIELRKSREKIHLHIHDNGTGFSVNNKLASSNGIGLRTMHSRAIKLDGLLRINSKLGKGTTISIDIPANDLNKE